MANSTAMQRKQGKRVFTPQILGKCEKSHNFVTFGGTGGFYFRNIINTWEISAKP